MGSKYFSAGEHELTPEFFRSVVDEPFCGIVAVVCAGGPGVFGREAIAYGKYGDFVVVGHILQVRILTMLGT